jgi:hypothetical protein
MNQALFPASVSFATRSPRRVASSPPASRSMPITWVSHEETARLRRLQSLLGLFSLYAAALLILVAVSDGADIGCILGGIAGHVLYATHRIVLAWRDASWLEDAKARIEVQKRYA